MTGKTLPRTSLDLIVYDFDGVMTDNKVMVDQDGRESVVVNRADGLGVNRIKAMGIEQIILSTEENPVVSARARKLGIPARQGCKDKMAALKDLCDDKGVSLDRVAYVGNDMNDFEAMSLAGWKLAPSDSVTAILELADIVTTSAGGNGVVREIAFDIIAD